MKLIVLKLKKKRRGPVEDMESNRTTGHMM
jgi:hypothetical protein